MTPEFIVHESCRETAWDKWIAAAQKMAGHDLDGDGDEDGYCLDWAYEAFCNGITPANYVGSINNDARERDHERGCISHGEQMNDYLSSGYAGADGCSPDF